jgi:hypothetical protein
MDLNFFYGIYILTVAILIKTFVASYLSQLINRFRFMCLSPSRATESGQAHASYQCST